MKDIKQKLGVTGTKEPHLIGFGETGCREMESKHPDTNNEGGGKMKPVVELQNKTLLNESGAHWQEAETARRQDLLNV